MTGPATGPTGPEVSVRDTRWDCEVTIDGHRCPDLAVQAGRCAAHEYRDGRRWRLQGLAPDGKTVLHDSRVDSDADLNTAVKALEARPDWTRGHRVRVSPA